MDPHREITNGLELVSALTDYFTSPEFGQIISERVGSAIAIGTAQNAVEIAKLKLRCAALELEVLCLKNQVRASQNPGNKESLFGLETKGNSFCSSSSGSPHCAVSLGAATHAHKKKAFRNPWDLSLSDIFAQCQEKGILSSVKSFVSPDPADDTNFCSYHVIMGHKSNECGGLVHEIKRLIKEGVLEEPRLASASSTTTVGYEEESSF